MEYAPKRAADERGDQAIMDGFASSESSEKVDDFACDEQNNRHKHDNPVDTKIAGKMMGE